MSKRILWIAGLVAAAVTAGGCGGETSTVPPVAGDDDPGVFEAYNMLRSAGFRVEVTRSFGLSTFCDIPVLGQWPEAGARARQGSVVELTIGSPTFGDCLRSEPTSWDREKPLPSLVGMRISDAMAWLERNDLGWSLDLPALPATNRKDFLDAYVVDAQDPDAGHQAPISYSVHLEGRINEGALQEWRKPNVRVPHVERGDLFEAYRRIRERGLRVSTDARLSRGMGQEIWVLGQRPAAGTSVPRGTNVLLRLRRRPFAHGLAFEESRRLRTKRFVGETLGAAVRWANPRNVYWELRDAPPLPPTSLPDFLDAYVVTAQTPREGMSLPRMTRDEFGNLEPEPIQLTARLKAR